MSVAAAIRYYRARDAQRADIGLASIVIAADFVTGGIANFARACSAKGDMIEIARRGEGEPHRAFVERQGPRCSPRSAAAGPRRH